MTKIVPKYWTGSAAVARKATSFSDSQMPKWVIDVIDTQVGEFEGSLTIEHKKSIPDTANIPLNQSKWLKIPDVVCVYVDMKGSTQLSASAHEKSTARAYQLFTGTAIRLFDEFESPYIDVKGDGVFALFDANQVYRALAAAVSFKTFASRVFVPKVKDLTKLDIGCHIGIDQKTVLVRKLGLKQVEGRTDRQNEVWAGKPVNMAAKLASLGEDQELHISDRYYEKLSSDYARKSCGCSGNKQDGDKVDLWSAVDVSTESMFDFNQAWRLGSEWCKIHGKEFCEAMIKLDEEESE